MHLYSPSFVSKHILKHLHYKYLDFNNYSIHMWDEFSFIGNSMALCIKNGLSGGLANFISITNIFIGYLKITLKRLS